MHKTAITISIISAALLAYGIHFINAQLPELAEKQAIKTLQDMGFQDISIAESDIRINAARFKKIKLDADGISTIDHIEIQYSPLSLMIMGQPNLVKLHRLTLIGELDNTGAVSIAGWNAADAKLNLQNGNLRTLVIEKGRLSLLTDELGGLNIDFDIQTRATAKQVDLQGHIKSQQRHLSMIAGAKGFINQDGLWQAELEVTQGKFNIGPVKAARVNGVLKLSGRPGSPTTLISELQAGGTTLYGYPWQNASATFEGNLEAYTFSADMKSIGHEGLELGLSVHKQQGHLNISGQIHSGVEHMLGKYIGQDIPEAFNAPGEYSFVVQPEAAQLIMTNGEEEFSLELK